jgi:amidohydrolase
VVDREKWFYAVYRAGKDKRSIAFRADFDAIPLHETTDLPWKSKFNDVAHKCGHDGHCAAMVAFALEVDQRGADKNIFFLFQHAEETGEGAKECLVFISENGISEIYAFHNMPGFKKGVVYAREGTTFCASSGINCYFTGHPSHASEPEKGINPCFAISELVLSIDELISEGPWNDLVMCTVINIQVGEPAFGVSPGEGVVRFTCRAAIETDLKLLIMQLEKKSHELAAKHNLTLNIEYQDAFPETIAHGQSVEKIRTVCEDSGIPFVMMETPIRASEDFGYYTKQIPGAMFIVGAGDVPEIHTHEYDFDDDLIEIVASIYLKLASY